MTIVINIKATDGAILLSDCLMSGPGSSTLGSKIKYAHHTKEEKPIGDLGNNKHFMSGAYVAVAGNLYAINEIPSLPPDMRPRDHFLKTVTKRHNAAYDLTDSTIEDKLRQRAEERRARFPGCTIEEAVRYANYLPNLPRNLHCSTLTSLRLIEATLGDKTFFSVLRFSVDFPSDLVYIASGKVIPIDTCLVFGKGKKHSEPIVKKEYRKNMTVNDAFPLAIEAMNAALAFSDEYRGYQLVIVRDNVLPDNGRLIDQKVDSET